MLSLGNTSTDSTQIYDIAMITWYQYHIVCSQSKCIYNMLISQIENRL